jgi:hypothetical protein
MIVSIQSGRDLHSATQIAPCGKDSSPHYFVAYSVPEPRWSAGGRGVFATALNEHALAFQPSMIKLGEEVVPSVL